MSAKKRIFHEKDEIEIAILQLLLEQKKPIRNKEIIKELENKRRTDKKFKNLIKSSHDSFRIQITNRLQRLFKDEIIQKKIISPKKVVYWIKDPGNINEIIEREKFKRELSGKKFLEVQISTEKMAENHARQIANTYRKILDRKERGKLKDEAKRFLFDESFRNIVQIYSNKCKIHIIYSKGAFYPQIEEKHLEKFYGIFLGWVARQKLLKREEKDAGFSIIFNYIPGKDKPPFERDNIQVKSDWLNAKGLNRRTKFTAELDEVFQNDIEYVDDLIINKLHKKRIEILKK
jgi:hypothetical protein